MPPASGPTCSRRLAGIRRAGGTPAPRREISQLQKRVSFRAEWSERSERNAVEESRKLHQGSLVRFLDSATPSTLQQSAGLRSARNDTLFFSDCHSVL